MRPPSSVEHPAEAKISATKASSAFALMVTVIRLSSWSCGPRASSALMSHERAGSSRSGRRLLLGGLRLLLRLGALQGADIAAVPGRVGHDLVDHDVRRQA